MQLSRHAAVWVAVSVCLLAVLVPAGVGYAAYQHDVGLRGQLPAGSTVGQVPVNGMRQDEAVAAVRAVVERKFDRPATLQVGQHDYTVTPRQLGVTDDVSAAVATALRQSERGSWLHRAWNRVRGHTDVPHVPVHVTSPSSARLDAVLGQAVQNAAVPAVDAQAELVGGLVQLRPSKPGQRLDPVAASRALSTALNDGTTESVAPIAVAPKVPDSQYDTVLVVHTGENMLYVYKQGSLVRTFSVATGSPRYPTPLGRFRVELKRYLPTWVNPGSGWATGEPSSIGPGPKNPLGTRALNISAPGIRIHGTPSDASVGYSVSHGCIRMHMADVEALYPMVPKGATVFIAPAGPPRFPTSAASQAAVSAPTSANAADGG